VVRAFLAGLGLPAHRLPPTPEAQTGLYRSLLADRRVLLVLDNARDEQQVRPLLPGAAGCVVVVTSRGPLTGLVAAGAHPVPLARLDRTDARALISARVGAGRAEAEAAAVDQIAEHCARLPLALAVAAARAATRPDLPLAALAAELADAAGSLDPFASGDPGTDVRAVLASSYAAVGPAARRLFRLLARHPGPSFTPGAAGSLAGVGIRAARQQLAELARTHLLAEEMPGRYGWHDLLHAYALEQAEQEPDDAQAEPRLLDHLLAAAAAASLVLDPHRDPIPIPPPAPGVVPVPPPEDHARALSWFVGEHQVLLAAVDLAAAHGHDRHTWQLAWSLSTYLYRQGHWHDQARVQRSGIAAARRAGDRLGEALGLRNLALADVRLGSLAAAERHFGAALALLEQVGDLTTQAHTLMALAFVADQQGHPGEAAAFSERALAGYRAAGNRIGEARALGDLAWHLIGRGEHRRAVGLCRQALEIQHELRDLEGAATAWDSLGYANLRAGEAAEAVRCYRRAAEQRDRLGDRFGVAETLGRLGDAHVALGDPTAARASWLEAVRILDELGHPDAAGVRAKLDGLTPAAAG
jgi:tetratricopeptide (TPR) repeat protein